MGYTELIKKVQDYSGFSDQESKEALQLMVESLAVHLPEGERRDFAGQLPQELEDLALSVWATEENSQQDMLSQFMNLEKITEAHAKKQIKAAWRALRDTISMGQIEHIKTLLPNTTTALLR